METEDKLPTRLTDTIAVWSEMIELTSKYDCESLGEGAPSFELPKFLRDAMIKAIDDGHNQYTRTFGHPSLVSKIADVYSKKI